MELDKRKKKKELDKRNGNIGEKYRKKWDILSDEKISHFFPI